MSLVKINDLTAQIGISSRSLRYYEQVGLLKSLRPEHEKYRFYDEDNVARLNQILVLRKMEIPIKDILRIYESAEMSAVVEAFVNRLRVIDEEVVALSEMRRIVNEFLQTMLKNGVTKISALPLLYEEMGRQLEITEKSRKVSYKEFNRVSEKLMRTPEISIVELPPARMLSSIDRESGRSDAEGFFAWLAKHALMPGMPGKHELFEYQSDSGQTVFIQRIDDDLVNDGPYTDFDFAGGLFAACGVYADEDIGELYKKLEELIENNASYEADYRHSVAARQELLAEAALSPEGGRERITLYLAVKRRLPDVSRHAPGERLEKISVEEIENANPVLWKKELAMDALIPRDAWSYHLNEQGEGIYTPVIDTHTLATGVAVALPFRVDLDFLVDNSSAKYGYGADEGNICFLHGGSLFGMNKENYAARQDEALLFDQPIFNDRNVLPGLGKLEENVYHHLTWIVGERHLAVILNGEVRFCGVNMPYMAADWYGEKPQPVFITANGSGRRVLKSVSVSQLQRLPRAKLKAGPLAVSKKRSNNRIPILHRLITSEHGQNHWLNGCAAYVMECAGEKDYDYDFFAGLTGDNLVQPYARNGAFFGDGVSCFLLCSQDPRAFFKGLFGACGYTGYFVSEDSLQKDPEPYVQALIAQIDSGIPVILYGLGGPPFGVFVGYESGGKALLYITGDSAEPQRMPLDVATGAAVTEKAPGFGWAFLGKKEEQKALGQLYRAAVHRLPELFAVNEEGYCFGASAFRTWADEIDGGRFDGMRQEAFEQWSMYTTYVCCLATNSGGCQEFLSRAQELNPDFTFLVEVRRQYAMTGLLWNGIPDDRHHFSEELLKSTDNLEAAGGGFNVTLEALQDLEKRTRITAVIRRLADRMDEVVRILKENLQETEK